jgi:elongation factor G
LTVSGRLAAGESGERLVYPSREATAGRLLVKEPVNVIEVAVVAKTRTDVAQLEGALERLRQSQPWIGIRLLDTASGQIILSGKSEQELEAAVSALADACAVNVDRPMAACRETLTKPVMVIYTHKKQIGGAGEFAEVKIYFEPLPPGSGFVFENHVINGNVPKKYIEAIESALKREKEGGLLAGFPVIDFGARLVDGKYHEIDSNALTFEIAARGAFRELATRGALKLLEPIMKVEVITLDDYFGAVIRDLNSRGHIHSIGARGGAQVICAMVPMRQMFGYSDALRAATDGVGRYTMTYDHHEPAESNDDPRFPGAAAMRVA